jgi:hypothetical protein
MVLIACNSSKEGLKRLNTFIVFTAICIFTTAAYGHGGKTHSDDTFTSLQALQKATVLFDKLVEAGKLTEGWETRLVRVEIKRRPKNEQAETVVTFQRSEGTPSSVYIYFSEDGNYAGSNFDGK